MTIVERRTLREQLSEISGRIRRRYAQVRPVSQVQVRLDGEDGTESFHRARSEILAWMAKRAGVPLPSGAWEGEEFDLQDVRAQRACAIALDEPVYWAARLDDADKDVPQRTWSTEVGLAIDKDGTCLLGCRLLCVTRGEDAPYLPSVPGIVRQTADSIGATLDGWRVKAEPWFANSEAEVDDLVGLLCRHERRSTVFVASLPEADEDPTHTVIPCDVLARLTAGAAHVVIISGPATYYLTDRLGKEFSVFHQGVRTYRPTLDVEADNPFDHPLALPHRITDWQGGGADGFVSTLVAEALRRTVTGKDLEAELPSFTTVQQAALQRRQRERRDTGASDRELLELAWEENESLRETNRREKETYDGLLEEAEAERNDTYADLQQAKLQINSLQSRVSHLEQALKARSADEDIPLPDNLEELGEWADRYLSGSVTVMNRARRAAKKSPFEDVELVYKALLLLRDHYVPMRREGGIEKKGAYEQACRELGLEEAPSFAGAGAGEQGDAYFVQYGSRRRELDRHLKGSSARDERYGFRLYFFWDDENQHVVVGWLPSHLRTRVT